MNLLQLLIVAAVALAMWVQFQLQQTGVRPIANRMPELPVFPDAKNMTGLVEVLGEHDLVGPEAIVESNHYLFATLGDGRIARLQHDDANDDKVTWEFIARTGDSNDCSFSPADFAETEARCGRPLGLKVVKRSTVDPKFEADEDEDVLMIADAYKGLLLITNIYAPVGQSQVVTLATRANSDPKNYHFQLLNALVQDPSDGSIYISETSQHHARRRIFYAAMEGRSTGRLLRYTKEGGVEVVWRGIYMPNGLALSHDGKSILVVGGVQIWEYSLTSKKLLDHPFVAVLPGTGDNIDAMNHLPSGEPRKCYWAGLGSKFAQPFSLLKLASDKTWLKSILFALVPYHVIVNLIPKMSALAVYDEKGELIEVYRDDSNVFPWVSEGESFGGYVYLGSWHNPFLARVKENDLKAIA